MIRGPDSLRTSRRRQRGQALVELAIVTPLLLLLLSGVVDTGRIIFAYIALEDAVQEGAIFMAHQPSPPATVVARVRTSSNHPEVTGATIDQATDLVCTLPGGGAAGRVSVTARYDLPLITPIGSQIFGGSFAMSATFTGTNFKGTC